MVVRDLLVKDAPARLSPVPTMAGQSSRGIGSTKFRPNSYKKNKTTRQGRLGKEWIQRKKYKKYPHKEKTTYSWRRVICTVLGDSKRNDTCSFQHLLKTLEYLLVSQLKGRDHTRRILSPRVLKTKVLSLLQRLNTTAKKTRDDSKAGQALLFQSTYPLKKQLDRLALICHHRVLFPSVINQGTRSRMNS